MLFLVTGLATVPAGAATFDLSGVGKGAPFAVATTSGNRLSVEWTVDDRGSKSAIVFDFSEGARLIESLSWRAAGAGDPVMIARDLEPCTAITVGTRFRAGDWNVFFDKPWKRPYERIAVVRHVTHVSAEGGPSRLRLTVDGAGAGSFSGSLEFTFFDGEPLVQAEAVLTTSENGRAILYDAGLVAPPGEVSEFNWIEPTGGEWRRAAAGCAAGVRITSHRAIAAIFAKGSIAVFPPPHLYIDPMDHAVNPGFNWAGRDFESFAPGDGWGVRLSPEGDNRSAVWVNAPPGTEQRLRVYYLVSPTDGVAAMEAVKRFTNGDRYRPVPGYKTFASHFHVEHTLELLRRQRESGTTGIPPDLILPGFVRAFRAEGVDIVHLAEFHNHDTPFLRASERLHQLHTMFTECERLSDDSFLLIPGEEGIVHIGGHWMTLFSHPVYWVQEHLEGQPVIGTGPDGGRVYYVGSGGEVLTMMEAEDGLMWTSHPRIKSSPTFPDAYRDERYFLSSRFLGVAWKAMPMDYSEDRLGKRVLDLMDEMANWGVRKQVPGEVDIFKVEPGYELYGHSNVNYLRLDRIPRFVEGWKPVLEALRGGRFFTTTGEVLIPEFTVNGIAPGDGLIRSLHEPLQVHARLLWTFPLHHAEIVGGDGTHVFRHSIDLSATRAFGEMELNETVPAKDWRWIRLEVWDVAVDGAYTQQVWIE